jgi:hypothetical protein
VTFLASGMKKSRRLPDPAQRQILNEVRVELAIPARMPPISQLPRQHHYLRSLRPVGQRLHYLARDTAGQWVVVLIFSAAAKRLEHRDEWIGRSEEQRRRRLSLVTNNSRFLLLPDFSVPNLESRVPRLTLIRFPELFNRQRGGDHRSSPQPAVNNSAATKKLRPGKLVAGDAPTVAQPAGLGHRKRTAPAVGHLPQR